MTVRFGDADARWTRWTWRSPTHEIVCVLGPSGSGKSTLLRVVAGLPAADAGRVLLDGRGPGRRCPRTGAGSA